MDWGSTSRICLTDLLKSNGATDSKSDCRAAGATPTEPGLGLAQVEAAQGERMAVEEPQSPALQPIFVPVRPISLRSTSLNLVLGSNWLVTASPFRVKQVMPFAHLQNNIADQPINAEQPQLKLHAGIGLERAHHQLGPIR